MKKIGLGQTVSIIANVGVIAGILFLAVELRQNNQLLQAEAIGVVLETRMNRSELNMTNPDLVRIILKNRTDEPMTPEEEYRLRASFNRALLGWQRDFFLFQAGILEEQWLRANFGTMRAAFRRTDEAIRFSDHWEQTQSAQAAPGYREFITQCIISDCETIPR